MRLGISSYTYVWAAGVPGYPTPDRPMTAQAVPSVAPQQASKYFKKLDCFCFTTQEFAAHETRELPVRFIVDSKLPDYVDTITLSYTFFDVARLTDNSSAAHASAK